MVWQDIVIMAANIVFSVALIPQVFHGFKKKKGFIKVTASLPTFIGLYAMSFSLFTLSLFFSAVFSAVTGTLWLMMFIQRLIYQKAQ